MDKQTILSELTKTGEINVHRRSANWEKAFKLYKDTTGRHKSMSCGTCYKEVKGWLQS